MIAVGKATRLLRYFLGSDKRYTARVHLGARTTTDDAEGEVIATAPFEHVTPEDVGEALASFCGTISQVPPAYSALHVDGKRAYELARKGAEVTLQPRTVHIYRLVMTECQLPEFELDITCSGGTYIRSIARDLGKQLHSEAYLCGLRRTEACHFCIDQAQSLHFYLAQESLEPFLIPLSQAMFSFERIDASYSEIHNLLNGLPTNFHVSCDGIYTVWYASRLMAILERKAGKNDYLRLLSAQEFDADYGG